MGEECEFQTNRNLGFTHHYIPGAQKIISQHVMGIQ